MDNLIQMQRDCEEQETPVPYILEQMRTAHLPLMRQEAILRHIYELAAASNSTIDGMCEPVAEARHQVEQELFNQRLQPRNRMIGLLEGYKREREKGPETFASVAFWKKEPLTKEQKITAVDKLIKALRGEENISFDGKDIEALRDRRLGGMIRGFIRDPLFRRAWQQTKNILGDDAHRHSVTGKMTVRRFLNMLLKPEIKGELKHLQKLHAEREVREKNAQYVRMIPPKFE